MSGVARVVVVAGAGAVHRRRRRRPRAAGPAAASPAPRRTRAGSTRGLVGLSAVVSPAASAATKSGLAAPPPEPVPSACSRRPSGPAVPPKPYGDDRRDQRHRRHPLGRVEQVLQHDAGAHAPADQVHPVEAEGVDQRGQVVGPVAHAAGGVDRQRVGLAVAAQVDGEHAVPPGRPRAASSVCCQNSAELTLPCTNSTASPGPPGRRPPGAARTGSAAAGRHRVAAIPGSRTSAMAAPRGLGTAARSR